MNNLVMSRWIIKGGIRANIGIVASAPPRRAGSGDPP
jgi:hypothetical protein